MQHDVIQSLNHFLMCAYKMYRKRLTLWNEAQERLTKGKAINKIVSNLCLGKECISKPTIWNTHILIPRQVKTSSYLANPVHTIPEKNTAVINLGSFSHTRIGSGIWQKEAQAPPVEEAVYSLTRHLSCLANLNFGAPINQSHCYLCSTPH